MPFEKPIPVTLNVSFADTSWTGEKIPSGQQCNLFGGNGATPPLRVANIPEDANAIIIEFNDRSFAPLSKGGGHGTVGYWTNGEREVVVPAVPGMQSQNLPNNTFIERRAQSTGSYASPGYLPPCSGGRGHTYVAEVKAVFKATESGQTNRLLATKSVILGKY